MHFDCCTKQVHISLPCKAATTHLNFINDGEKSMINSLAKKKKLL